MSGNTYRATVILMFDFPSSSIEEARKFGDTIHNLAKGVPVYLDPMFQGSIVKVARQKAKDPNTKRPVKNIVVATMPADEMFALMDQRPAPTKLVYSGVEYKPRIRNHRLRCFKKNPKCVVCDIEGVLFALERNWTHEVGQGHWSFYGEGKQGNLVLMTVDHCIPLSKGGADHPDNFQTMCVRCNTTKKDDLLTVDEVRSKLKLPPRQSFVHPSTIEDSSLS